MKIDFHTHLDWYENTPNLIEEIKKSNHFFISASVNYESYIKTKEIAKKTNLKTNKILPTFGIHPEKSNLFTDQEFKNLQNLEPFLKESKIIGEIGLDYYWVQNTNKKMQTKVFRFFLEHCHQYNKPCVIHTKGAENEVLEILKEYPNAKPIIHWFSGDEKTFLEYVKRDYFFTFGCGLKYSTENQKLLQKTPINRLLLETDNPTAEPWLGGNDFSINLINRIYCDCAKILNIELNDLENIIQKNAKEFLNF